MKISLSEILSVKRTVDLDLLLKKYNIFDLNSRRIMDNDLEENWKYVGDNISNASSIDILRNGEKGVIERLSNGIDSVLERKKIESGLLVAETADDIMSNAFPIYYNLRNEIKEGRKSRINPVDASNQVILAFNTSGKSNRPTIDVIDTGTGLHGDEFSSTILSLQGGNKIRSEKSYLIGSFGQGGSTSLSFCDSTLILSKKDKKYFFTVVKRVNLEGYKNHTYVYLVNDSRIIEVNNDIELCVDNYLNALLKSDSGTLVRMIETDVAKKYRDNSITKPTMFNDYINTELFNVALPIKVVENRSEFVATSSNQDRYSHGSRYKLLTSTYVRQEYSGIIEIEHRGKIYNIEYFSILPIEEDLWGNDTECRSIYNQFNVHNRPIIYTVNGQYINGERFTKIKNSGLNFLENRILVVVNLDVLGSEKYSFFTPDRSSIKERDLTIGFVDKIVEVLSKEERLILLNDIIAEKSISSKVDKDLIEDISRNVQGIYYQYLRRDGVAKRAKKGHATLNEEDVYFDEIKKLEITTKKDEYYRDEEVFIHLKTEADRVVNKNAKIFGFLNGKSIFPYTSSFMNGRIVYTFSNLSPGNYEIFFETFEDFETNQKEMQSNVHRFEVLNEKSEFGEERKTGKLNIEISFVVEKEVICDIVKTDTKIIVYLCLEHDEMLDIFAGKSSSQIKEIQKILIKPVSLFGLFMDDVYSETMSTDDKNRAIVSLSKTVLATFG